MAMGGWRGLGGAGEMIVREEVRCWGLVKKGMVGSLATVVRVAVAFFFLLDGALRCGDC